MFSFLCKKRNLKMKEQNRINIFVSKFEFYTFKIQQNSTVYRYDQSAMIANPATVFSTRAWSIVVLTQLLSLS